MFYVKYHNEFTCNMNGSGTLTFSRNLHLTSFDIKTKKTKDKLIFKGPCTGVHFGETPTVLEKQ